MDEAFIGEIFLVAFNYAPDKFVPCDGRTLPINENPLLFQVIGTTYGGNGTDNFAVPDLRGRVPLGMNPAPQETAPSSATQRTLGETGGNASTLLSAANISNHTHAISSAVHVQIKSGALTNTDSPVNNYPATAATGSPRYSDKADDKMMALDVNDMTNVPFTDYNVTSQIPYDNRMPYLSMFYVIALDGIFPQGGIKTIDMPKVGDVFMGAFNTIPPQFQPCDGRLLEINKAQALFGILGVFYGGDGRTTFRLPDMRGRVPVGAGAGPGLSTRSIGQTGGVDSLTITPANLPSHTHNVSESLLALPAGNDNDTHNPIGTYNGKSTSGNIYSTVAGTGLSADLPAVFTVDNGTAATPVSNLQPYMAINFFIAVQGDYPAKN